MILIFILFQLILNQDLSIDLLYKYKRHKEIDSFLIKFNKSVSTKGTYSSLFCNILNKSGSQVKYFLYPEEPIKKDKQITRLNCFTNIKTRPEEGRHLKNENILNVEITNTVEVNEDIINSIELFGFKSGKRIQIEILKRSFKYVNTKNTDMRSIDRDDDLIEVETRYGYKLLLDRNDDMITRIVLKWGMWQNNLALILINLIEKSDNVLHLGGHIGTFDILIASLVGNNGKVIVFEPVPKTFQLLLDNVNLNHVEKVVVPINKAAYSSKTKKEMFFISENGGGAYISNENKDNKKMKNKVIADLIRIDEEFYDININFVFMDIEGSEVHAYNGMRKLLKKQKENPIMIWEWGISMIRKNYINEEGNYIKLLDELSNDYDMYILDPDSEVFTYVSSQMLISTQIDNFDILFMPKTNKHALIMKKSSLILINPQLFSGIKENIFYIRLNKYDINRCQMLVNRNKLSIGEKTVICFVESLFFCLNDDKCNSPSFVDEEDEKDL